MEEPTVGVRPRITEAVERLKGLFLEIPGTQLTLADASKLSGLDHPVCELVLGALEDAQFLTRGRDGLYQRRSADSPNH
jgi:hypothetical protein